MTTLQLVQVHSPEQVAAILEEAETIVTGMELEGEDWRLAFSKAVDLLGARIPLQPQAPLFAPPDLGLRRG